MDNEQETTVTRLMQENLSLRNQLDIVNKTNLVDLLWVLEILQILVQQLQMKTAPCKKSGSSSNTSSDN